MWLVYGILFGLLVLQAPLRKLNDPKRIFCMIAGGSLTIVSACKAVWANGDLMSYSNAYALLPFRSFSSLYTAWRAEEMKDLGFYAVGKVFADSGASVEIWMAAIALLFAAAFSWYVYRNSRQPWISVLMLLTLFFSFTLSGLRQVMALAVVFCAYECIKKQNLKCFLIAVLIAYMFHSSALIFLPAYWVAKLKMNWKQPATVIAAVVITLAFPDLIRELIERLAWNDSLAGYAEHETAISWAGFVIQLFIVGFCALFKIDSFLNSEDRQMEIDSWLNCMVIGICFQCASVVVAEAFRLSYYYSICCVAAVPNVIMTNRSPRNRTIMIVGVCASLLAYMLWSGAYRTLTFFWQV